MESPPDKPLTSKELSEYSSLDEFSTLEELALSPEDKKMENGKEQMEILVPEDDGLLTADTPRFSEPEDDKTDDSFQIPQVDFSDSQDSDHPAVRSMLHYDGASSSTSGITKEDFPDLTSEDDQFLSSSDVSIPMGTGTSDEHTTDTESGDRTVQTVLEMKTQPAVSEAISNVSADFVSGTLNLSLSQYPLEGDTTDNETKFEKPPHEGLETIQDTEEADALERRSFDAEIGQNIDEESGVETPPHEDMKTIQDNEGIERRSSEGSELSEHPLDDDFAEDAVAKHHAEKDELSQHPLQAVERFDERGVVLGNDVTVDGVQEPEDVDRVVEEEMFPLPQEETEDEIEQPVPLPSRENKDDVDLDFADEALMYPHSKVSASMISDSVVGKKPIDSSTPYFTHEVDPIAKIQLPPEPRKREEVPKVRSPRKDVSLDQQKSKVVSQVPSKDLSVPGSVTESDSSQISSDSIVASEDARQRHFETQQVQFPIDLESSAVDSRVDSEDYQPQPEQSSTQSIEMRPSSFYIDYPSDLQSGSLSDVKDDTTDQESVEHGKGGDGDSHVWNGIEDKDVRKMISGSSKTPQQSEKGKTQKVRPSNSSFNSQDSLARRVALLLGETIEASGEVSNVRESESFHEPEVETATETQIEDIGNLIETGEAVGGVILPSASREPIKHSLSVSSHEYVAIPEQFDEPVRQRIVSPLESETGSSDSVDSISRQVAEILDRTHSLEDLSRADYQFRRPYSPAGSDSTTSDSITRKVEYLLEMVQSHTRDVAEGLDYARDQTAQSPSTLSEASTSSSVRAIIERVMARHGRPDSDIFNGSGFMDANEMYKLPDRSSPAGSADFEDDLAAQTRANDDSSKQLSDLEVQNITDRSAIDGLQDDEERDIDSEREGSPDSLTEQITSPRTTHDQSQMDLPKSSSYTTPSARFSFYDDAVQRSPQQTQSATEIEHDRGDQIPKRTASNVSGVTASSDSLHRRVQHLLASTAYVENIPPARMSDPETTPRETDVPDGGYEELEVFYGKLPTSPTQSFKGSERSLPDDDSNASRKSSPGILSPTRLSSERISYSSSSRITGIPQREDRESRYVYSGEERQMQRSSLIAPVGDSQERYEPYRRTEPEGRSSLVGDPVLRRRIAARLLEDSADEQTTESLQPFTSTVRDGTQDIDSDSPADRSVHGSELPPISSVRLSSDGGFRKSTLPGRLASDVDDLSITVSSMSRHTGRGQDNAADREVRVSATFGGAGREEQPVHLVSTSRAAPETDDSSSLAERVRKILEKESPVHHADEILNEADQTIARDTRLSREAVDIQRSEPVDIPERSEPSTGPPFMLHSQVTTTDSLPYSPISSTGYRPIGASRFAQELISKQMRKATENRFDQSVELRQQVTSIIDKNLDKPTSTDVPVSSPQARTEPRERTYYQDRPDDSSATPDDAVRRAIHDAWTVRDSPTPSSRTIQYGVLPRYPEQRELPVGVEERDTLYGVLPASSLPSTERTSQPSSEAPLHSSVSTNERGREYFVMSALSSRANGADSEFTFRKSFGDSSAEALRKTDAESDVLPKTQSRAKPLDSESVRFSQNGDKPLTSTNFDDHTTLPETYKTKAGGGKIKTSPRTRGSPVLRPYRPPGSPDLFHIYLPEQDDASTPGRSEPTTGRSETTTGRSEVTTGRSETTMESTHSGSDDAFGPYVPQNLLGSRTDNSNKHPTGIYGTRTPRSPRQKVHVWNASQDPSLMISKISERSTDTDPSMEIHVVPEDKNTANASTESLRSKPARSFIEYPSDLRSKTPTEAANQTKSPVRFQGLSPGQPQVQFSETKQKTRETSPDEEEPLDIADLSTRPARSFIEYPSDLKSQSATSMTADQDAKGSSPSRTVESKPIPIPSPVRHTAGKRSEAESGLGSREKYLHEQPMATSPIRTAASPTARLPSQDVRHDMYRPVGQNTTTRDAVSPGSPGRTDRYMYRDVGREKSMKDDARRVIPMQQPLTTMFEISKPSSTENNVTASRPVGVGASDYQDYPSQRARSPPRYTSPEEQYRRPVIGRDYSTVPATTASRDYEQLSSNHYARVPPSHIQYGVLPPRQPVQDFALMPDRDYATLPPPSRRPTTERSYSHAPEGSGWTTTGGDNGGTWIDDGFTTWPPRGEARHERRSTAPAPASGPQPGQRYSRQILQEILEQEDRDAQRLGEMWEKFQEMLKVRAEESSDSISSERIERLAQLIENPVQHTVRQMKGPLRTVELYSDSSSTVSSVGSPGRQRRKWQRHEKFTPKQQSEEAIDDHHEQTQRQRFPPQTTRSSEGFMTDASIASTNDSISTERIAQIITHTQPLVPPQQQQRRPTTEQGARRRRPETETDIDARRIQEILATEATSQSEDPVTDASMSSNMSYETERLYKMLGPRGVRHLGVKLARLQRKIDKQRERHDRSQAKKIERQKHYDKQRDISESTLSSSTSVSSDQSAIDTDRLVRAFGSNRVDLNPPTIPTSALSPVPEADLQSVTMASITTESTITEEKVKRTSKPVSVKSTDDFNVKYGSSSDITLESMSDASCCQLFPQPKRASSLHDIAEKRPQHHPRSRDFKTYHRKSKEAKAPEKKQKRFEYFEIDDDGFKKPLVPAPKSKPRKTKSEESDVRMKDVGMMFPSPDVQTQKKKRGGTAFTVALGTQTTPKRDEKPRSKRQLKVLEAPKVEKSKIYTPETPDAETKRKPVPHAQTGVAWFAPITTEPPWKEEVPPQRKPLTETQTKAEEPPERNNALQDAFEKRKLEFISKSRERVKRVQLAAEERKVASHYERERLKLFEDKYNKKSNPQAHPYSEHLHQPKRRQMSQKEMKKQTEKIYSKLPEVVRRKEEQKKQQAHKTNRIRAQIYKQSGRASYSNGRGRIRYSSGGTEEDP